jgi:hypothetical protein
MTYYDGDPATLVGPLVGIVLLFAGAVLYARLRNPSARRAAARRITAIDKGQRIRLLLWVCGTYGDYPRKWRAYIAYLEPAGLVLRPNLLPGSRHRTITITEPMVSAHERPYADFAERRRLDAVRYAATEMQRVVVTCQTSQGILEFGVRRGDMPLLLHYLQQRGAK